MAVPKKRRSKAKKRTRRACWTITAPNLKKCAQCGEAIVSHQVCSSCGFYKGRQVIQIKVKSKETKDA
jgi:large subunit ribosomal protein L32